MFKVKICNILEHNLLPLIEAKNYLRVSADHEDDFISSSIESAILYAESYLGYFLKKREIIGSFYLENYEEELSLPHGNIIEITKFREKGSLEDLEADSYEILDGYKIKFKNKEIKGKEYEFSYISGFDELPHMIKSAVLTHL